MKTDLHMEKVAPSPILVWAELKIYWGKFTNTFKANSKIWRLNSIQVIEYINTPPPPNPFLFASKDFGVGQAFSHKR